MNEVRLSNIFLMVITIGVTSLAYIVTPEYKLYGIILFLIIFFISCLITCNQFVFIKLKIPKGDFRAWSLLLLFSFLAFCIHNYTKISLIYSIVFLFISYLIANFSYNIDFRKLAYIMCRLIGLVVLMNLIVYLLYNNETNFVLLSMFDKNWSGVLLFYFFTLSLHIKSIPYLILCIISSWLTSSRMLILSELFCIIVYIIINNAKFKFNITRKKIIALFLSMFIFTFVLSNFWIMIVVPYGPTISGESINDNSNAARMISNLYGFDYLKSDYHLLLEGYDNDIFDKMGIIQGSEETNRVDGFRIVQPHNVYLNFILKHGVIISLIYYYIISSIFARTLSRYNLYIMFPVLFESLIFHTLLSNYNLLLLTIILLLTKERYQNNKEQ